MSDDTYNGWKNYPTWCVNLWLANEEPLYNAALEIAQEKYDAAETCSQVTDGIWTVEEARRFTTADRLKDWVEAINPMRASMRADLLGWALAQVDWNEIADAWLESAAEAREYA